MRRYVDQENLRPKIRPWSKLCLSVPFCWLIPMLWKGSTETLELDDMYPVPERKSCKALSAPFAHAWEDTVRNQKPSIWKAMFVVSWKQFSYLGLIYFIKECVFRVGTSIYLGKFLQYYGHENKQNSSYYLLLLLLCSASYQLINSYYLPRSLEFGYLLGVRLTGIIYEKALRLRSCNGGSGHLTNVMSSDIKRFEDYIAEVHCIWVGPVVVFIIGYILYDKYGWLSLSGLVGLLPLALLGVFLSRKYVGLMDEGVQASGVRQSITDEIITGIRFIKTYTWELLFEADLDEAREAELRLVAKRLRSLGIYVSFSWMSNRTIILIFLASYILTGNYVNSEKLFVTISLYNTAAEIITLLYPSSVYILSGIIVATRRIEKFLLEPENKPNPYHHQLADAVDRKGEGRVLVEDYSGNWTSTGKTAIANINVQADSNHPLFIIGSVGSGKTALISGILGSLDTVTGRVTVEGSISYAAQNPWVFTGSVKENILFGKPFVEDWYTSVLDACCLTHDLSLFSYGDSTLIGDRGITLSGGQKARISLARALYSQSDVYLFDDVLSAVDAEVGRLIFRNVFHGLLKGKCVLLVTHQIQYVGDEDSVICLEDGKAVDAGRRRDVEARNPQFFRTLVEKLQKEKDQQQQQLKTKLSKHAPVTKEQYSGGVEEKSRKLTRSFNEETRQERSKSSESSPLIPPSHKEGRQKGLVGLKIGFQFLWAGNSPLTIITVVILLLGTQACHSGLDMMLSFLSRAVDNNEVWWTQFYLAFYASLLGLDFLLGLVGNLLFFYVCICASRHLHKFAVRGLIRSKLDFFETNPTGRIMNRFSKDLILVDDTLPNTISSVINYALQIVGIFVNISILNPVLVIPFIVGSYILAKLRKLYLHSSSDIQRLEAVARSPIFSLISTTLDGIEEIRVYRQEDMFRKRFEDLADTRSLPYLTFVETFAWFFQSLSILAVFYQISVILALLFLVPDQAAAGLSLTLVFTLAQFLVFGMERATHLENNLIAVERLEEYSSLKSEASLEKEDPNASDWEPRDGSITVEQLEVCYGNNIPILHDINCTIKNGEKVGIVGRSGSGKSSLVSAFLRLLEPTKGRILIGGTDIQRLGLHELRSKISIISQIPGFLGGTLRRNLDPFSKHTDEDLCSVIQSVQLGHKIRESPQGIFQEVSYGGSNFSQGEGQLISLARALLAKNSILILDEATASVDFTTDEIIQREVREKCASCTVITIAHRIESVLGCDRICVLHDGYIVEFDTPANLLQDKESRLSMLIRMSKKDEEK